MDFFRKITFYQLFEAKKYTWINTTISLKVQSLQTFLQTLEAQLYNNFKSTLKYNNFKIKVYFTLHV